MARFPAVLIASARDHLVLEANPAMRELTGLTPLLGLTVVEALPALPDPISTLNFVVTSRERIVARWSLVGLEIPHGFSPMGGKGTASNPSLNTIQYRVSGGSYATIVSATCSGYIAPEPYYNCTGSGPWNGYTSSHT